MISRRFQRAVRRFVLPVLGAVGLVVVAGGQSGWAAAAAAPAAAAADPRVEARAKLKTGAALMERGDYAGALAAFESAYALVASPKIQFNIGSAYEALARYAAAYEAYSRFVADPQDARPDTVAKARASVAALEKKIGRIAVASDVAGDQIFIDGQPRGVTPLAGALVVDPGAHAVTVKRGEAQRTENLSVTAGEAKTAAAWPSAPPVVTAPPSSPPPSSSPSSSSSSSSSSSAPGATLTVRSDPDPASQPPSSSSSSRPIYKRAWFWGVVAAVAIGAGIGIGLATRKTTYPNADHVFDLPDQ